MNNSSGNKVVDEMLNFNFDKFLCIPAKWFETIKDERGKVDLLAINILADVVYRYRPTAVIDQYTGRLKYYKKNFEGDMYEKSIGNYCDQFCQARTTVQRSLTVLENLGVITRFIDKATSRQGKEYVVHSYIQLNVDVLRELTYPSEDMDVEAAQAELPHREEDLPSYNDENMINTDLEHPVPNRNTPVPNRNTPVQIGTPPVQIGTHQEDLNNNNIINKSSSSNILINNNISPKLNKGIDDDDRSLRERVSADRIMKLINNKIIVDTLIKILLKRNDELTASITSDDFMDICLDILAYPNKISNYEKFITKCVDNFCKDHERRIQSDSKEVIDANKNRDKLIGKGYKNKPSYHFENENQYDFNDLEKRLLNEHRDSVLEPIPGTIEQSEVSK